MNQLVHLSGDRLVVTSLEISNHFGKRHDDVLRAINNLDCSHEFRRRNFAGTSYHDRQNKARPMYEITRDGFVFLCMGFTGQQAAIWKERYIEAFNQMEKTLRGNVPAVRQHMALDTEVGHLKDMVASRDAIIAAKNDAILSLQARLIGSQDGQIKLLGKVANLEKRQRDREVIQLIERMEAEGRDRAEIAAVTGKNNNYIRQRVHLARLAGRLPRHQPGGLQ